MLSFRTGITKWFTLVEILIVLALIGLFAAAASYLTHDSRIAQKNATRLADNINTTFRTARSNMVLGKWVYSGSTLVTTGKRVISISSTGANASITPPMELPILVQRVISHIRISMEILTIRSQISLYHQESWSMVRCLSGIILE